MKQSITIYPNKELFEKTQDIPIEDINSDTFSQIGSSMLQILKEKGGIGLSANQVGLSLNMCVVELAANDPKIMLNPRIVKQSDTMVNSKEGCLSLPGAIVVVKRHKNITVEYEDVDGQTQSLEAESLLSCCLQHEIDHLKGVLMINRVNEFAKTKALKMLDKFRRNRNGKRR